jgi:hypothetical protein
MSEEATTTTPESQPAEPATIPQDVLEAAVAAALAPMKEKLDKAYNARDTALAQVAEKEQKEKEAEIARLNEEGKHKEAYEMQLAQEKAAREVLEKRVTELSRDGEVRSALSAYTFRTESAANMAFKEVIGDLVKNEQGQWVQQKSGKSINDAIKAFLDDDANSFLLKPKSNSGAGSSPATPNTTTSKKSLFEMTQEEVLQLAAEGKLPRRR